MKYLYSILVIIVAFVALPSIIDHTTSAVNHMLVSSRDGVAKDDAPEAKKARDKDPWTDDQKK